MQYVCDPLSRCDIRSFAYQIRKAIRVQNQLYFPVTSFLEVLPTVFKNFGLTYEIVDNDDLPPEVHAQYVPSENCIYIKEFVYEGACKGIGRDRMTIMHEIAHFLLLTFSGIKFQRTFDETVPPYRDPEWQAKCLAGEILIPANLIGNMSAEMIAEKCHVSLHAARYQLSKLPKK